MGENSQPGFIGTQLWVIPPAVANNHEQRSSFMTRSQPQCCLLLIYQPQKDGRLVGLATHGNKEICWYDVHEELNPGHLHGSTMVYSLCYSCMNIEGYCSVYNQFKKNHLLLASRLSYTCQNDYFNNNFSLLQFSIHDNKTQLEAPLCKKEGGSLGFLNSPKKLGSNFSHNQ